MKVRWINRSISIVMLSVFGISLFLPFVPEARAATIINVSITKRFEPGYYWCQHIDGHWSTWSSIDGTKTALDDGGVPKKTRVKTGVSTPLPSTGWKDAMTGKTYDLSEVQNPHIVEPVILDATVKAFTNGVTSVESGVAYIDADTGKGTITPIPNSCGSMDGFIYEFPIDVKFEGTVTINDGTAYIKHYTEGGSSLSSVFNDRTVPLVVDQSYSYTHPSNAYYEYVGYKKSTTGTAPSGGSISTGEPPSFNYDGSFPTYYVHFYYRLKSDGEPTTPPAYVITGDVDILPSNTINWRDNFSLKPKNVVIPAGCTYQYHEYRIERNGTTWTSSKVFSQSTTSAYTHSTYPYVIGVGSHNVSIKITANCASSEWTGTTLTVNGPASNNPPTFEAGWTTQGGVKNRASVQTSVLVGTTLDLVYLDDPAPDDPDGDTLTFVGFDFTDSNAWAQQIPSKSDGYTNGFHNILMDTVGFYCGTATMRDIFGADATRRVCVDVVPPNPVPVITGSITAIEGRPLVIPFSSANSFSPISGRTINHSMDIWTNKKTTYSTVGTEVVTLEVFDNTGLKSLSPASHTIRVNPDLLPLPELNFIPTTVRGTAVTFTNTSYSPDGDALVTNTVKYQYDSNNDGIYSEAAVNVTMDANKQFKITPTKVGRYQLTLTVVEDWGKQATKTFILNVVNENPSASFFLKGTIDEPTITPVTPITAATIMGGTWGSSSLKNASLTKRWAIDTTEGSIVSTTDKERFSGISTNVVSETVFKHKYLDWVCSGNCAPNNADGEYTYYLGGNNVAGRNYYYDSLDIWDVDQYEPIRRIYYHGLTAVDRENGIAYGYRIDKNTWPYKYYSIAFRIADLLNPNLTTVPYLFNELDTTNSYWKNPYTPAEKNPIKEYAPFALDIKYVNGNVVSSYHWGSYSSYSSTTLYTSYKNSTFYYKSVDQVGNIYALWEPSTNGTSTSYRDLVKLNNITGQIDWKINYETWGQKTVNVVGDGKYTFEYARRQDYYGPSSIIMRNTSDGSIIRQKDMGAWGPGTLGIIGLFDGKIIFDAGVTITVMDYNLNVLWSYTNHNKVGLGWSQEYGSGVLSKDGYFVFPTQEVASGNGYYRYKLSILNLVDGTVQSFTPDFPMFDDNDVFTINQLEYLDDSMLFIRYSWDQRYSDGSSYGTYHYATVLKTTPNVNSITGNEAYASGQLTSPSSLNTANGEFYFNLKFNGTPNGSKSAGFGFRIQDNKNLYRVEVFKDSVQLVKYVNGVRTVTNRSAYPVGTTTYTSYKIKAVGTNIRVYASNTPIIDVTDTTFTSTGGFGPYSAAPRAEMKSMGYKLLSGGANSTLTDNIALVDSNLTYVTSYLDAENDPKVDPLTKWTFVHTNPNKFLNSGDGKSGLSSLHNQTVQTPYLSFDRVGLFNVTYTVKDDPNASYLYPNMQYDEYRKPSDPSSSYVISHRKPIVNYTLGFNADSTVKWTDTSYDPDRWLSSTVYSSEATGINYQTSRGIVERKYYFIAPSGVTKMEKLITPTETGTYTVGMAVKDEYSAWSDWLERTVTVSTPVAPNDPPMPGFNLSKTTVYRGEAVTITTTASDPEDGAAANIQHEYYIKNETAGDPETLQSTNRGAWTKAFNSLGLMSIRQVVCDSKELCAQTIKKVTVLNRPPVANFDWMPKPAYEGDTISITNLSTDLDGDSLTYSWNIEGPNGFNKTSTVKELSLDNTDTTDNPGSYTVKLTVQDSMGASHSVTRIVNVSPLGIQGYVKHTEAWETNRLHHNEKYPSEQRPSHWFWAGEAFVLEATITNTGTSQTKPISVEAKAISVPALRKSLAAIPPGMTSWGTLLLEEDTSISFDKLVQGAYSFIFTVHYSNGVTKTSTVPIRIQETVDSYVQVHRIQ